MTDVNCLRATGQNWSPAPVNQAQSAVDFLKATTAFCTVSANSCVRVSCVGQAAVYLCNNVRTHHTQTKQRLGVEDRILLTDM